MSIGLSFFMHLRHNCTFCTCLTGNSELREEDGDAVADLLKVGPVFFCFTRISIWGGLRLEMKVFMLFRSLSPPQAENFDDFNAV